MAPRTKKERIFRHMARDTSLVFHMVSARSEWIEALDTPPEVAKALQKWQNFVRFRYGGDVKFHISTELDPDFNLVHLRARAVLR